MNIQPKAILVILNENKCFFCNGKLEFLLNESVKDIGLKFRCSICKLMYLITKSLDFPFPEPVITEDTIRS